MYEMGYTQMDSSGHVWFVVFGGTTGDFRVIDFGWPYLWHHNAS